MRLRPDLALLPLGEEAVAFSEEAQCLLGLNASAEMIVRGLQGGGEASALPHLLASRGLAPPDQAEHWVETMLEALGSHGMLAGSPPLSGEETRRREEEKRAAAIAGMPDYRPFDAAVERRYRLLETTALIRFGSRAQVRLVNSVLGHLAINDDSAPTIVIDLAASMLDDRNMRSDIYRDTMPVGFAPRLSLLAPLVKACFWESAVNRHDFLFNIHAGVVGNGASCVLFPAAAGSGKSSLVAALTHRGYRYFSDEVALIEPDTFRVPALPLAMGVKEPGWDLISRYYPVIADLPTHRRSDGKVLRYIAPPLAATKQAPLPVSHIIFPRYGEDAPTEIVPVARSEALARLMAECLVLRRRLDRHNVADLLRWIEVVEFHALTFSALDTAVELVTGMIGPPPP